MREVTNIHQHSALSFADGVCSPEEVVAAAKAKGLKSIAITDHGHTHAHARFFLEAKKQGVRGILGSEAYVIDSLADWRATKEQLALEKKASVEDVEVDPDKVAAEDKAKRKVLYRKGHLVLLARNRIGLANLYKLTFKAHRDGFFMKPRMDKGMLAEHAEGLVASSACMGGVISSRYSLFKRGECEWSEVVQQAREFSEIFQGRFFLELQSNEADYQKELNSALVKIHEETDIPLIVTMDAHYTNPDDWRSQQILHMLLTHRGSSQDGLTFNSLPPDYRFDVRSLYVKSGDELWGQFRAWNPEISEKHLTQAFENTLLADSLIESFEPDTSMRLPSLPYEDTFKELMRASAEGLKSRKLEKDDRYMERLGYELGVIQQKGLANYFLVVRNIVEAARKEMRIGPGRGSAAGSLICYLTGITDIDPIEHKLMFERFINLDRVEVPDIDLDFEDVDRVKDILRRDFGHDNVACISTYGTNQIKGLLKDLSRVHGIDHNECNAVNKMIEKEMKAIFKEEEGVTRSAITIKLDDIYRLSPSFRAYLAKYPDIEPTLKSLYGKEHHVGRHASGVIIGDDLPAETSVFTSRGVVQASFTDGIVNKSASSMGLVKFDILGLATLKVISQACKNVAQRTGRPLPEIEREIDPKVMDFNDPDVLKKVFWDGNTCGIFSVTSAGMQKLFMRVKPMCFDDVAAVCALYRPGPLGSGMDSLFADRKNGIEEVTYDHPILEDIMRDTYGCLVYQEQMLEIGRRIGKMSWKDTNRLRKLFLKKDKSKQDDFIKKEEEELKAKLVAGAVENGLTAAKGEELWEMCGKFGGYGFNRCLAGETIVVRAGANDRCKAEVSLQELWDAQESIMGDGRPTPINKKMRSSGIKILQLDPDGRIRPGKLKKVHNNGHKPVYRIVTENGRSIMATENHRFFTPNGYRRVDELSVGMQLVAMGIEAKKKVGPARIGKGKHYENVGWPDGMENPCWIDGRTGFFKAATEKVRIRAKGKCESCGFMPPSSGNHVLEFAHVGSLDMHDGDYSKYHSETNILHLCNGCHKRFDYAKLERKPRWTKGRPSELDKIVSISFVGIRQTFDVEMETEAHNFIANDLVSHNSHSYSYGMLTMQTAHLRYHYPLEFFSALLSVGQADELQTYVNDIRKQGFKVLPVDVNSSKGAHVLEGDGIRLSLLSVKGVGASAVEKIVSNQPYTSLKDFLVSSGATKTSTIPLAKCGAFSELEPELSTAAVLKRAELWYADSKVRAVKNRDKLEETFAALGNPEDDPVELMQMERDLMGFNLRGTPFSIRDRERKVDRLRSLEMTTHSTIKELLEDEESELGVIPLVVKSFKEKPQRNQKLFAFMGFADRDGGGLDSVAFANIWEHIKPVVRVGDVYLVTLTRKEDDAGSFVVGRKGWKIKPVDAAACMVPIDKIEI